jgi:hypothetical protein
MVDNSLLELGKLVDFFYHMDYIDDLGETHNQLDGFMNLWLHGLLNDFDGTGLHILLLYRR